MTGFLLAGVGQKDAKGSNFLVVKEGGTRVFVTAGRCLRFCVHARVFVLRFGSVSVSVSAFANLIVCGRGSTCVPLCVAV